MSSTEDKAVYKTTKILALVGLQSGGGGKRDDKQDKDLKYILALAGATVGWCVTPYAERPRA